MYGEKNNRKPPRKSRVDYKNLHYCICQKVGKDFTCIQSDSSKFATDSALDQIQTGKPKLMAYASKRLPEAA